MNKIKAYGFMFLIYIVLYLNYIFGNENIQNITNVLLWLFVLLIFLTVIGLTIKVFSEGIEVNEAISNKGFIEKIIDFIILFGVPTTMLYFGDIFKGTMLLVSFMLMKSTISSNKKKIK